MPAKYTLVLRNDMRKDAVAGSKLYYANAKASGECGMYELCDLISLSSTASAGDVRLILDDIVTLPGRQKLLSGVPAGCFQLADELAAHTYPFQYLQACLPAAEKAGYVYDMDPLMLFSEIVTIFIPPFSPCLSCVGMDVAGHAPRIEGFQEEKTWRPARR